MSDAPKLYKPPTRITLAYCMTCGGEGDWLLMNVADGHLESCPGTPVILTYTGPVSRPFTDAEKAEHEVVMEEARQQGKLVSFRTNAQGRVEPIPGQEDQYPFNWKDRNDAD